MIDVRPALQLPLRFKPIFKDKVWGGRNLQTVLGKSLPATLPIGESWEISDHGEDLSVVAAGALAGQTLRQLIGRHPRELLGAESRAFPLLFKVLDAAETLSVQVHPGDREAAILEPGGRGKTEAWAILRAEPGAGIIHGIAPGLTLEEFYRQVENVKSCEVRPSQEAPLSRLFQWRAVTRGDVVYLPAGTIHAIGSGILLVEVQQSSDITYRIFDWGRPRPLHLREARRIPSPASPAPAVYDRWLPADQTRAARWPVVRSEYFGVESIFLPESEPPLEIDAAKNGRSRFGVLIGLDGEADLETAGGETKLRRGDFLLIPALAERLRLTAARASFSGLWVQE